ncbi:MAG: methionyl-tRNA formyltransferase, partial [Bacteroidales bacterium]|nr:methionyl-tRNA formyltransferase [Candidatus Cryptobacteroides equifaecalis]
RNFSDAKFMEWNSYQDKARAYMTAYDQSQRYLTDFILRSGEINQSSFWLRHTDIELLKKFAQALACLLLFFIGAPLGALMKKGGLGISAIVSVLFFVLYWVVDISGTKLAKDGAIDASTGAFISAYVLAPIGAFLTYKAVKDSEIFSSMDSFKIWWKKSISRIIRFFKPVRIVYMGTPDFAVAPLDTLIKNGLKVVGVVTVADKPSGRGLKVNESAVKKYAVEHGIPVLQPVKLKDPEFLSALKAWKADLFVVVAFRMLPEEVWKMPKLGTFNLHAALLPQYRGAAPINWAVINGERITGATTFMIDHQIDTGGIILRQDCRIAPDDTAGDVHDRLMEIGSELVLQTVNGIIENNVELRVQRSFIQGSEVLKPAPKLTRELCHIDWDDTTANIHNLIRGLSPYPTAFTELVPATLSSEVKPLQLKIFKAEKMELEQKMAPGTVISDGKKFLAIATRDGAISIRDLQLQGKKRMPVESFLLGFREPQGYVCTQGTSRAEIEKTRV